MTKKIVFIIPSKDADENELLVVKKNLEDAGAAVKVASQTRSRIIGAGGQELKPDLSLAEINENEFSALVLTGSPQQFDLLNNLELLELIQKFKSANKILAGIGHGPAILASVGALIGKTVTADPAEEEKLLDRGAQYTGMQIEVDGNVVTAKNVSAAKEFSQRIVYLIEV